MIRVLLRMAQSSLKMAADSILLENMNMPMKISDVANMLRKTVARNINPYTAETIRLNNALVDELHEKVLKRIADRNGCIPAGHAHDVLRCFMEGKEIHQRKRHSDLLLSIPVDKAEKWAYIIRDSSIKDLHSRGISVIAEAWGIVKTAIRDYYMEDKWRVIFSGSIDPYDWELLANKHPQVMNPKNFPFGLKDQDVKDMGDKVQTLISNLIVPH